MRKHKVFLATMAVAFCGIVSTTQAALLVYEPFDFTPGQTLNGLSGGALSKGMLGTWAASNTGSLYPSPSGFQVIAPGSDYGAGPLWKGYVSSLPQNGVYVGSPANHSSAQNGNDPSQMWASRPLDPSVTATFTPGTTTWMSYVQAHNFAVNNNYVGCEFVIGQGVFIGTGDGSDPAGSKVNEVYGGAAVGIGLTAYPGWGAAPKGLVAGMFDQNTSDLYYLNQTCTSGSTNGGIRNLASTNGPPIITIAKIVWGDMFNPTTVYMTIFTNGAALSEAAFNNGGSSNILDVASGFVDPTTFTNISLGGGRFNVDELRIGTTFADVIGIEPGSPGKYWAPTGQGGSGTWASEMNNWAPIPNLVGSLSQSPTNTLIFAGAGGTVTVNGTVTVGAGLQFSTDGYNLVPGSSTPQISLDGADPTANSVSVISGTVRNGVQVTGTHGMTLSGPGTFVLSNTDNTYGGGTILSVGTLQIAALGSLGTGNLDFQGGTLQYPPGSGTTALDVSGKIQPVASGQTVKIDTDGYDATFGTPIGGEGGLTKLGTGSLTLAAANTYAGTTTVRGGTLNINSASGVIATLNVPTGGTVNLGAGAVVTALNVTGGTANITGAAVQVGTLFISGGTLTNPSAYTLTITNSANLKGTLLTLNGASFFTLGGADLINPTISDPRVVTATGGTLSVVSMGLDAAIGLSAPGAPAVAATATFLGNGAWTLVDAIIDDINDTYGRDNHGFHYIPVPTGDFDIKCHVTGTTGASAGVMARDSLAPRVGHSAGIWTALGTSTTSSTVSNGVFAVLTSNTGIVTPWLEVRKVGNLVGMYSSEDGVNYALVQEMDFSSSPWGSTTYIGIDLINTAKTGVSASFEEVNFMGNSGTADLNTTKFALIASGGEARMNTDLVLMVDQVSTNGVALPGGCWGSSVSPAIHVDDAHFQGTGMVVVPLESPLTIHPPADMIVETTEWYGAFVTYPAPTASGGVPPYVFKDSNPPSGSAFVLGTNLVTCGVTDSGCPPQTVYGTFKVIVVPPTPEMPLSGFSMPGGVPTFEIPNTVASFTYTLVYKDDLNAAKWTALVGSGGTGGTITLSDPTPVDQLPAHRYYRIQAGGL